LSKYRKTPNLPGANPEIIPELTRKLTGANPEPTRSQLGNYSEPNRSDTRKLSGAAPETTRSRPETTWTRSRLGNHPELTRKLPGAEPETTRRRLGTYLEPTRNPLGAD
jgi:hypothetical protein